MTKEKVKSRRIKTCLFALVGVIALLGAGYIFQVSSVTAAAYAIASQERKIENLIDENRELHTRHAEQMSFRNIELIAAARHFEKISSVQYVQLSETAFALQQ